MTVAELIAALVALDKSSYLVDVRCLPLAGNIVPRDGHDGADLNVLGVAQVVDNPRRGQPMAADGWVTLELEEDSL